MYNRSYGVQHRDVGVAPDSRSGAYYNKVFTTELNTPYPLWQGGYPIRQMNLYTDSYDTLYGVGEHISHDVMGNIWLINYHGDLFKGRM